MRTLINLMFLGFALLALAACGGKGIRHCVDADPADDEPPTCVTVTGDAHADAFYAAQREAREARQELQEKREARIAALVNKCASDDCVRDVAREATMSDALMVAGGGASAQPVQQFVRQAGGWERAGLAALGQVGTVVQGAVSWRSSDNAVRTAEAQFGFLGGVVDSVSTASARSNEAAFGILPQLGPRIEVGGNYGDTAIAGRDMWGNENRVGPDTQISTGAINTGTQNDGGVIGSGQIGDGRQNAPGPWVGNNDGEGCVGPGCQQAPLPEPEPEPEEGEGG